MNKLVIWACLFFAATSFSAWAQLSANANIATDYLFRGFSQTDNGPALQVGLDYSFAENFTLGSWASNVTFGDEDDLELDFFAAYNHDWDNGFNLNSGYVAYTYIDLEDANADDLWLGIGYKSWQAKIWKGFQVDWTYIELNYSFALPKEWTLGLHAGRWDFDAGPEVADWKLSCSRGFKLFNLELALTDTDTRDDPTSDARAFLILSKTWSFK